MTIAKYKFRCENCKMFTADPPGAWLKMAGGGNGWCNLRTIEHHRTRTRDTNWCQEHKPKEKSNERI